MSSLRNSPLFPETLPSLPRRAVLLGLAAAPSACVVPTTGQAFSSDLKDNERYAEAERLMSEINATYGAFLAVSDREGEFNEDGEDIYEAACDRWLEAKGALRDYAVELAAKPTKYDIDTCVLMKIADFQLVDDLDFNKNLEPSVPAALRAGLQSFGITPTEKTATSIESAKFDAETASRSPRPEHVPMPVNAGNYIIRIRDLKRSFLNAVALACSLEDDTPKWLEAEAEADRIQADLDTLRDEIIAGVNRALSERSEMSQVHLFAVWIELIEALSPGYLSDASHHFAITPVFRQLKTEGTSWAETFVEDATRWNAKNGGANV